MSWHDQQTHVLAEGQSLSSYKRMRYAQSFETPKQKKEWAAKWGIKECKHSPSFDSVTWDKEKVLQALQNWPTNETINWTKFAGDCGIPGRNRGQIAKEFAKENGLDTIKLDSRQPNQRMRAKLFKLPGGGVSVPTHQSTEANKQDWAKMIAEGELTLGEPCAPHTLTKLAIVNGELKTKQERVYVTLSAKIDHLVLIVIIQYGT